MSVKERARSTRQPQPSIALSRWSPTPPRSPGGMIPLPAIAALAAFHCSICAPPQLRATQPAAAKRYRCASIVGKIAPIVSQYFTPLGTPANYTELVTTANNDSIYVVKFQAPFCRTCRATSPLLDRVAKQHPEAKFFSMDLARDGKAAGERMHRFFKEKKIKHMPYVEIWHGPKLIDTEIVPPSALSKFELELANALGRLRAAASTPRGRSRQMALLRNWLSAQQEARAKPTVDRPPAAGSSSSGSASGSGLDRFLARSTRPRRGAPQRGATGGRRKGWR